MSDAEVAYPAADSTCSYEGCQRPAWRSCPEGKCLYHSPSNGDSDETARLVWQTARKMASEEGAGACNFDGWHFPNDPDGCRERGRVLGGFAGFHFEKPVSFRGATFSADALFGGATFSVDAGFNRATFSGDARFDGATFSADAWFDGATFSRNAGFDGATFSGFTRFVRATFSGDARFDGATFSGNAGFSDATFSGFVRFVRATFSGDALFKGATFSGKAEFLGATFDGSAVFKGATFNNSAVFRGARFSGNTGFKGATFGGDALFAGARFEPGTIVWFDSPSWHWRPFTRYPFAQRRYGEQAYRFAKQVAQERGHYTEAGRYHYAEQCAIEDRYRRTFGRDVHRNRPRRKAFRGWCISIGRFFFGRLIYGYGERPMRPLFIALVVIVLWAGFYCLGDAIVPSDPGLEPAARAAYEPSFGECFYCSIVTFTTLGYGDYQPKEPYRLLAASEALLGAALMAVFIVCLSKKYVR